MKLLTILIVGLITLNLQAQDSLVFYKDLVFNSDFEKETFLQPDNNPFFLFLAVDKNMSCPLANTYLKKYNNYITGINKDKIDRKSNAKKVKSLYDDVHDIFFEKYEMQNHFSQVFEKGFYNCVSATAIYGMVFSELDIPYTIKEKPTHVYLMAYPETDNILVESTDPSGRFLVYDDRYKAAVVEQLANAKLISESEIISKSANDLFNEFYFTDENINLKELAGLQYLNDALYLLEKDKVEEAFFQAEKAYFLYPKENIASLMAVLNSQLIDQIAYADLSSMRYLEKLSRHKNFNITQENILAEFERMTQIQLTDKGDSATYRKYYEAFLSYSNNKTLNHEVRYLYNLKSGLSLYNAGHYAKSLPFIKKAYELKPNNLDITNILVSNLAQLFRFESNNSKVIERLENYKNEYESLTKNNIFNSMLAGSYLIEFGQSYDLNDEPKGIKYRKLFEENYTDNLNVDQQNIGRAYSLAAIFYFKKGYKQKAISILNKGLELAPGNYELLTRKRMIE